MQKPSFSYADIGQAADDFLKKYHPSATLPVPIEEIVEQKMDIAVYAIPGIKDILGIDAFINAGFDEITIDEYCFVKYPGRTRFSVAHEIGHLILHKDWYMKYGPKNFEDYPNAYEKLDEKMYQYIEIQASNFAGLVLVPPKLLLTELKKRLGKVPSKEEPEILFPVAQELLNIFQVSGEVMFRRLQREDIIRSDF